METDIIMKPGKNKRTGSSTGKSTSFFGSNVGIDSLPRLDGIINRFFHSERQEREGQETIDAHGGTDHCFDDPGGGSSLVAVAKGRKGHHGRGKAVHPRWIAAMVVIPDAIGSLAFLGIVGCHGFLIITGVCVLFLFLLLYFYCWSLLFLNLGHWRWKERYCRVSPPWWSIMGHTGKRQRRVFGLLPTRHSFASLSVVSLMQAKRVGGTPKAISNRIHVNMVGTFQWIQYKLEVLSCIEAERSFRRRGRKHQLLIFDLSLLHFLALELYWSLVYIPKATSIIERESNLGINNELHDQQVRTKAGCFSRPPARGHAPQPHLSYHCRTGWGCLGYGGYLPPTPPWVQITNQAILLVCLFER